MGNELKSYYYYNCTSFLAFESRWFIFYCCSEK